MNRSLLNMPKLEYASSIKEKKHKKSIEDKYLSLIHI